MANFFNPNASSSSSVLGAPKTAEQSLHDKIMAAILQGHWVVSIPWGSNPRKRQKDGKESQHLLMTQKGPIGFGQYGVFGSIRTEGFIIWEFNTTPEGKVDPENPGGGWQYPTAHKRGDEGDVPVPGAKVSGMHRLMLANWKAEHLELADQYRALGEETLAKEVELEARGFQLSDVFGKQITFSIPLGVDELKGLQAQGFASAGAGRKPDRAVMVHNMVLSVDFTYSEEGEYGLSVVEVLETSAPLRTIPLVSRRILSQERVLRALSETPETALSKEEQLKMLEEKREVLASKQGVNAQKKEARKLLKKRATALGVEFGKLQEYLKQRAGGMGLVWGVKNLQYSLEDIQKWMKDGENTTPDPAPVPAEKSVEGGLLPKDADIDAADIDIDIEV